MKTRSLRKCYIRETINKNGVMKSKEDTTLGGKKVIQIKCKGADTLPIDRIVEFQGELKKLSKENENKLRNSILKHGFIAPIFVWDDHGEWKLLDGHQRIKTLLKMRKEGYDIPLLPVDYIEADSEEDAKRKLLHITSQYGEFTLDGFENFTFGLDGFEDIRLTNDEFVFKTKEEEGVVEDDYEIPEEIETDIQVGDVFEIGEHRLMCGDSTDQEMVTTLMNNNLADMVVTDPPYNVDYTGGTKDALKIMNDKKSDTEFYDFLYQAFSNLAKSIKRGGSAYVFHADTEGLNFRKAFMESGFLMKQCLIWEKNSLVMGRQDYQWMHEPILYGWLEGASHSWYSDRKQTTLLKFDRPIRSKEHPTMKPVSIVGYLIKNSSKEDDIILDTFLGSGTTMVASHQLGRKCYGMELDPKYCKVIIDRMKLLDSTIVIKKNGEVYE